MMRFKIRTAPPRGRGTWAPDLASKVQDSLFKTVAMLVAANPDAEAKLMDTIKAAKGGDAMGAA